MKKTLKERNERQKIYRLLNNDLWTKRYEKTKKGFLMRLYRNMKSRVLGVQKLKYHLYQGKHLLPKEDFYKWALNHPDFHKLFDEWEKNQHQRILTPSVDRIDSQLGYIPTNMRWLTFQQNSSLGGARTQVLHQTYKKNFPHINLKT